MKEMKIQIPDNCELVKDGDSYVVREKRQNPPRSWEEFCERYPVQNGECFITSRSNISSKEDYKCDSNRHSIEGRNWCASMEEAEAFLALMQLRQLRKAWVGDWEHTKYNGDDYAYIVNIKNKLGVGHLVSTNSMLTFPTEEMAKDFLICFGDLCETAKILL